MALLYTKKDKERIVKIEEGYRSPFRRDYARLIHSPSFRRLQGKTQLFPGKESDFFRNRLTHSLEVAQIAKSIAQYLNSINNIDIDEDVVECAGLAHDLGHPPFGHNGEKALDYCMREHGGFEGNAQTLRILSKLDKKTKSCICRSGIDNKGIDKRNGLNLTFRTLAAVLKYDKKIPTKIENRFFKENISNKPKKNDEKDMLEIAGDQTVLNTEKKPLGKLKLEKGYYKEEEEIVHEIKKAVLIKNNNEIFKTIECQIVDIADDIAYSTYDIEDAFKAEFIQPLDLVFIDDETISKIKVNMKNSIDEKKIKKCLLLTFIHLFDIQTDYIENDTSFQISANELIDKINTTYLRSHYVCYDGYERIKQTSLMIDKFIKGIKLNKINKNNPALTKIYIEPEIKNQIEILKHFIYIKIIDSPIVRVSEFRGYDIIKNIYNAIEKNLLLLPKDYKLIYDRIHNDSKKRIICDFIAGMTDRYALEFHGRFYSDNPVSIFKQIY